MPLPDSPREVFPKNVLKEVVCQLRFPSILRIKAETPATFQGRIRDRYPMYDEESPGDLLPPEIAPGMSIRLGSSEILHKFLLPDRTRSITLSPEFLAVSDLAYLSRDDFREQVMFAENHFRDEYAPAFYVRIGVRYKNLINRKELRIDEMPWHEILNGRMLGELGVPDIRDDVTRILTRVELKIPDIADSAVRINHGLAKDEAHQDVYLFDADFFTTRQWREANDVKRIVGTFSDLNGKFFRWAVTNQFKDVLRRWTGDA